MLDRPSQRVRWKLYSCASALLAVVAVAGCRNADRSSSSSPQATSQTAQVDFSRDIRPILNQNCVGCHGGVRQKAGVSFIFREEALGIGKSGNRTIIPGDPDHSELMTRVLSHDSEAHMPYHGPMLNPQQIDLLRRWIKQGARFDNYWAFEPPKPETPPDVKQPDWVRQPMDRFILARLEKEGLKPSPETTREDLLRRASLDITGLPPTPQETATFLADHSPNAYEHQVDRLLASPRYGERWASMWLDLARYADTKGYERDTGRPGVWPYRDWVVDAYNQNLPYDQFVVRQIAGDLLPHSTMLDRIATSFHRQTPGNDEGGTDDEEFRMVAAMDRVATTWQLTSGITMNCVQCHSHPYDPIKHVDYYTSLAFFNTQRDADLNDDSPTMRVPREKAQYDTASALEDKITGLFRDIVITDRAMEGRASWKPLHIDSAGADDVTILKTKVPQLEKGLAALEAKNDGPADVRTEKLDTARKNLADTRALLTKAIERGRLADAFTIHGNDVVAKPDVPAQSVYQITTTSPLSDVRALRIEVPPSDAQTALHTPENGFVVNSIAAWLVDANGTKTRFPVAYFAQDTEDNLLAAQRQAEQPNAPTDLPSPFAAMPKLFRTRWIVAVPTAPVSVAPGTHLEVDLRQEGTIDDKPAQVQRLRLSVSNDPSWTASVPPHKSKTDALFALDKQLNEIPAVGLPVMVEQAAYERRETKEFERGNFLTKTGPALQPDVPGIFPAFPKGAPRNRLTLARWFFQPDQPLTARVAVNRYWEELFGTGIVETLENFGSVGEMPSHPELLDWLALHFQNDLHWNMKALVREIVTSAAYRQSASVTPALAQRDPRNRLLARGPQQRLSAEMIRDQALVASGLLNSKMGGPPAMPPQPEGVWNSVYSGEKWTDATGPERYRRALYTFIKRTSGYPSALIFDASDRDTMLPRRIPTTTPLQALVILNDPVYQECAQALAQRVTRTIPATRDDAQTLDARITMETQLVLSRPPSPRELDVLRKAYTKALAMQQAARLVRSSTRPSPPSPYLQLAGYATVANILFNLDAALVR